jgi:uncharacterized protein
MNHTSLSDLQTELEEELPNDLTVTRVVYEGPELVVYTGTPREFARRGDVVARLARTFKKRISIRPTPETRTDPRDAEPRIRELIPDDAGIEGLEFYPKTGEVIIEAEKPGLVIGRRGSTFREISQEVGWTPEVLRTPPMESSTVSNVRNYLIEERAERRELLERIGERIYRPTPRETEWVRVTTIRIRLRRETSIQRCIHLLEKRLA